MASLRLIRRRLRSIQNTKQVMRAMQLVAGSKLKRSQDRLFQVRAGLEFLDGLLQRVLAATSSLDHPLSMKRPEATPSALVIFTSDTGLCGAYNTNLIHLAESYLRRDSLAGTEIVFIGRRAFRYFTMRGFQAQEAYLDLAGRPDVRRAEAIGRALMERFLAGRVASIQLLYSQYVSATVYRPTIMPWLPVEPMRLRSGLDPEETRRIELRQKGQGGLQHIGAPADRRVAEYIFEPSPRKVFEDLLPRWTLMTFQQVYLEACTSEHSARMIAMKNATDNAEDILEELTQLRNKLRQATITKEISELIGTTEAQK